MREVELRVQIEHAKTFTRFLEQEAKFLKEEEQLDEYFSPINRSFIAENPVKEWLRLRTENEVSTLTYKLWHYEASGTANYCDEHESQVVLPDEIRAILRGLGFESLITVHKLRTSYLYEKYEISLDTVTDLGSFIEIEWKGKDGNPGHILAGMLTFLKGHAVGKVERNEVGYPKLALDRLNSLDLHHG